MNNPDYKKRKAFTLIELLVVIAIIGILASVILSYLSEGRKKASTGAVYAMLIDARSQAAIFFEISGSDYLTKSYDNVCGPINLGIGKFLVHSANITNRTSGQPYADDDVGDGVSEVCHDAPFGYAVWIPLENSTLVSGDVLCLDASGVIKRIIGENLTFLDNTTVCP